MKKYIGFAVGLLALFPIALMMFGCSGGNSAPGPVLVTLTPSTPQSIDQGQTVSITAAVGGTPNMSLTWSLSGPGMLTNEAAASVTYSAPTSGAGTVMATVTATSKADTSKTASVTVTVAPPPAITAPPSLPDGTVGSAYNQTIQASGGTAPFAWTVSSGSLPGNLALSSSTTESVTVSGTPSMAQSAVAFTIQIKDSVGIAATKPYTVNINNPPPPAISTSPAPPPGTVAVPYIFAFGATGGLAPLTWSVTGVLPAGMTLTTEGKLYGNPGAAGSFPISVTATDSLGQADTQPFTIVTTGTGPSNARLTGNYAFLFQDFLTATNGEAFVATGSFVADGSGGISGGLLDTNMVGGAPVNNLPVAGSYSFDTLDQGSLELKNTAAGVDMIFRFVTMGPEGAPANSARLIEYDSAGGGTGFIQAQDATAFSTSGITGDYIFGFSGSTSAGGRTAAAGRFTADGLGGLSGGVLDVDEAGANFPNAALTGSYSVPAASTTGRGTATLNATLGGSRVTFDFAFYIVSPTEALFVGTDPVSASVPLLSGATAQQVGGPFSNVSMNGTFVYATTGQTAVLISGQPLQDVSLGLIAMDGAGKFSLTGDENQAGTIFAPNFTGTYSIGANGRVTLTGEANPPVLYLAGNIGFIVGTDSLASAGTFQKQTQDATEKTTLDGTAAYATAMQAVYKVDTVSGANAFSQGNFSGNWDFGTPFHPHINCSPALGTYTISSNGRGLLVGTANFFQCGPPPPPGNFIVPFYVVGRNTFVEVNSVSSGDQFPIFFISTCQQTSAAGFGSCP